MNLLNPSSNILVIGSTGQVASCLKDAIIGNNNRFLFVGRPDFDISSYSQLTKVIEEFKPNLIINASAYTAVDKAEDEAELAYKINAEAVENLAIICQEKDIVLIHLSTDYVFDGNKISGYSETDQTNPLSVYGKSKLAGEESIRRHLPKHIIIRTSWVFSQYGTNFVKTMCRLAHEKDVLQVVSDQKGCPTYAGNIASVILKITSSILSNRTGSSGIWGTYHYSDSPVMTWYEFASEIFSILDQQYKLPVPKLIPITTAQYPTKATRPFNSVLDCSLIKSTFGIAPSPSLDALRKYCLPTIK